MIRSSCLLLTIYLLSRPVQGQSNDRKLSIPAIFAILRWQNSPCNTESNTTGTCLVQNDCLTRSGTPDGTCAQGYASCCNLMLTCGGRTKQNETIFVNNQYPRTNNGTETCQVIIDKLPYICQFILDFDEFTLAESDVNGQCTSDSFTVIHTVGQQLPILCGHNSTKHLYVDIGHESDDPVVLSVVTNGHNIGRKWKIKINMIPCNKTMTIDDKEVQYYLTDN